jgi:hypothetical protein
MEAIRRKYKLITAHYAAIKLTLLSARRVLGLLTLLIGSPMEQSDVTAIRA